MAVGFELGHPALLIERPKSSGSSSMQHHSTGGFRLRLFLSITPKAHGCLIYTRVRGRAAALATMNYKRAVGNEEKQTVGS